jgi:hypothetical protein
MITRYTFLILSFVFTFSQQTFGQRGYKQIFSANGNAAYKLRFTKTYSHSGDTYVTFYKIYSLTDSRPSIYIKATHIKSNKHIVVDVEEAGGGIFSHLNTEETDYDTPSLKLFGIAGDFQMLAGDSAPNQLAIKFSDKSFTYVNVLSVNGTYSGFDGFIFWVLY